MKISTIEKNGVRPEVVDTISLLVARIPWPARRQAMAEVTTRRLDGKPRIAEDVFGWGRSTVELGMNELRTGIVCKNDLSNRRKLKLVLMKMGNGISRKLRNNLGFYFRRKFLACRGFFREI